MMNCLWLTAWSAAVHPGEKSEHRQKRARTKLARPQHLT